MRIVLKFLQGNQVNKLPRYFVGNPEISSPNPKYTYLDLDKEYNSYPSEGYANGKRYNPYDSNIVIDRDVIPTNNGYDPDTIYTKLVYALTPEGQSRRMISSQAGVLHTNNYEPNLNYTWPHFNYSNPTPIAPRITNGQVFYYNPLAKKYIPAWRQR